MCHTRAGGEPRRMNDQPEFRSIVLEMPPERIVRFKAIVESYDNLATLRTEDPRRHRLRLYFSPELADEVDALLDSLAAEFRIQRIAG
jgi:hypothetical protein